MDLAAWAAGFALALTPENLALCLMGALLGTLVGVLPGIGPAATLALLLPLTFALEPSGALIMLAAIYYGAQYGGSTSSILLNLPGECSGVVTAMDGHRMALMGRAGPALAVAALASLFAGLVTAVGIATVAVPLSALTTAIAPAGLVGLIALGLFAAAVISPGPALPALALILIGAGAGPGRHGPCRRTAALHLRHPRIARRHRLRAAGHGHLRTGRDHPRAGDLRPAGAHPGRALALAHARGPARGLGAHAAGHGGGLGSGRHSRGQHASGGACRAGTGKRLRSP